MLNVASMGRGYFSFILVLFFNYTYAQKETSYWFFGDSAGIYFSQPMPIKIDSFNLLADEACSSISDSAGNLLSYSDGIQVYNGDNKILNEHTPIKGFYSSSQGAIFIKHPKGNKYYLFTTGNPLAGAQTYAKGLNYTIIENFSDTIKKANSNLPLLSKVSEKQNATHHQNNNDIWLVTHDNTSDTFFSFLVRENDVMCCPIINKMGMDYSQDIGATSGILKFTPSGNSFGVATWSLNTLELCKFNKETSQISKYVSVPHTFCSTFEFSQNEQYIYVNDNAKNIAQYKIDNYNASSITNSKKIIISALKFTFGELQLGLDRKIYFALYDSTYLGVINYPEKSGLSCSPQLRGVDLGAKKCNYGLPSFNASYFYTPSIDFAYEQDCVTNTITFEGKDTFKANTHKWFFTKGTVMATNTTKDVSYTFTDTGKWLVKYIAGIGARSDTIIKTITIRPKLEQEFLGEDIKFCQINPLPLVLHAPNDLHCVHWYDSKMNELNKTDSLKVDSIGIYYCKATNLSFCMEWDTINVSNTAPTQNLIIFRNNNIISSTDEQLRYQWFRDNQQINDTTKVIVLKKNGTYKMYAYTKYGCWVFSNEIVVTDVAVNELRLDKFVTIFPNPNIGKLNIEINKAGNYSCKVYSLEGKLLLENEFQGLQVETINLRHPKGEYILVIQDKEGNSSHMKILIE